MAEHKLTLESRTLVGKKLAGLRKEGKIPSVVYGNETPVLAQSDYNATEKILRVAGYHSAIDLDIAGKKSLALVKSVAVDPVSRKIINVEFQAISADELVEATTPIVIVNFEESDASKLYHFAYTQAMEEIEVKAKPADLPKELTVDASKLASADDKLTVADIKLPKNVEFADKELSQEQVVASVYDPAAEAAAREAQASKPVPSEEASEEAVPAEETKE